LLYGDIDPTIRSPGVLSNKSGLLLVVSASLVDPGRRIRPSDITGDKQVLPFRRLRPRKRVVLLTMVEKQTVVPLIAAV
jgi:hypothetical protein